MRRFGDSVGKAGADVDRLCLLKGLELIVLQLPSHFFDLKLANAVLLLFFFELDLELAELVLRFGNLFVHLTSLLLRLGLLFLDLPQQVLLSLL